MAALLDAMMVKSFPVMPNKTSLQLSVRWIWHAAWDERTWLRRCLLVIMEKEGGNDYAEVS